MALAGIAEPAQKLEEYTKMNAIANFVSKDGKLSILAMKKESDYSKQIYNFGGSYCGGTAGGPEKPARQIPTNFR